VRSGIDRRAEALGWPALHAELAARDPEAAVRIRPADGQRIQRALEVLELTGERMSRLQKLASPAPLAFAAFALVPDDRVALYARIDARFRRMMEEGFLDEVRALRARGDLDPDLPSLRSVGYRQLWTHLAGACSLEQAVAEGQRATRNLAKRQLTWIRSEPAWQPVRGLDIEELAPIEQVLRISADA
jgi:tRNA dimethylallyltransferase